MDDQKLVFAFSLPRTGSTVFSVMLGMHPELCVPPEMHLLNPLFSLGYYGTGRGTTGWRMREQEHAAKYILRQLPRGEADLLDAFRGYADTIYARLLEKFGREIIIDRTPRYVHIYDSLRALYPRRRMIVLVRHPLSWAWSYGRFSAKMRSRDAGPRPNAVQGPTADDYAKVNFPIVSRALSEQSGLVLRVRYEDLINSTEAELTRVCAFLGVTYSPQMLEIGRYEDTYGCGERMIGDPTARESSTISVSSLGKWRNEVSEPADIRVLAQVLRQFKSHALTWGYDFDAVAAELHEVASQRGVRSGMA